MTRSDLIVFASAVDYLVSVCIALPEQTVVARQLSIYSGIQVPRGRSWFGREDAKKTTEAMVAWFEEHLPLNPAVSRMKHYLFPLAIIFISVAVGLADDANAADFDAEIRQGPVPVKAGGVGVGQMIPDFQFVTIDDQKHRLSDFSGSEAIVIAMTGTGCPLCQKYTPTLAAIEQQYRDRGVQFLFVNPNESEDLDRLRDVVQTQGIKSPYVRDGNRAIPQILKATTTTEVFVLDQSRTLVYRGAVDDQYGFGYALAAPKQNYLKEAIEAVLAKTNPRVSATTSPGCALFYGDRKLPAERGEVTYHRQISRIINRNCIECHRDTGIAPIPLETHEQVSDYAGMIRSVVDRGVMPPWFAAPLEGDKDHDSSIVRHWANERSLSSVEKADLFAWIDADCPEGDADEAPTARHFPDGWLIGKPDAVFEFPQPEAVQATGVMPYKNVTVETNLDEGKWVRAIEVQPGNRSVVHHVIVSLKSGDSDERSGYWGIYVPGNSTLDYPEGYAKWLPAGAKLRFQMHYTPNGTATEDSTRIGIIYAKQPPKYEVKAAGIVDPRFTIPAGANNHPVTATLEVPENVEVISFLPHMHLRGKAARYELIRDGESETLLDVPRYDFNWQLCYRLSKPRPMHPGDAIRYTSWYDNSSDNPANPDPTRDVRWGQQTFDEMHLGYVEYIVMENKPGEKRQPDNSNERDALFERLDVDGDGFITRAEVLKQMPENKRAATTTFDRLDRDKDDKISPEELSRL